MWISPWRRASEHGPARTAGPDRIEASIGNGLEGYYRIEGDRERLVWQFARGLEVEERVVDARRVSHLELMFSGIGVSVIAGLLQANVADETRAEIGSGY